MIEPLSQEEKQELQTLRTRYEAIRLEVRKSINSLISLTLDEKI